MGNSAVLVDDKWIGLNFVVDGGIEFLGSIFGSGDSLRYLPWIANPIFLLAIFLAYVKSNKSALALSVICTLCALSVTFKELQFPGGTSIKLVGYGYPAWVLSFILMCAHCVFSERNIQSIKR